MNVDIAKARMFLQQRAEQRRRRLRASLEQARADFDRITRMLAERGYAPLKERWHADLLHKMTLSMPDARQPIVADGTAAVLQELLRFRHSRRYCFVMEYDWDEIDYLNRKPDEAVPMVEADVARCTAFLAAVLEVPDQD